MILFNCAHIQSNVMNRHNVIIMRMQEGRVWDDGVFVVEIKLKKLFSAMLRNICMYYIQFQRWHMYNKSDEQEVEDKKKIRHHHSSNINTTLMNRCLISLI